MNQNIDPDGSIQNDGAYKYRMIDPDKECEWDFEIDGVALPFES